MSEKERHPAFVENERIHNLPECPHCHQHVEPDPDGQCPVCDRNFNDKPQIAATDKNTQ